MDPLETTVFKEPYILVPPNSAFIFSFSPLLLIPLQSGPRELFLG